MKKYVSTLSRVEISQTFRCIGATYGKWLIRTGKKIAHSEL
jgi:hypothetical protein